jgi:hypothetical protein
LRTDAEGYEAIEIAKRIAFTSKESAIVRLFAIAMTFYRRPVGDAAFDQLHILIGPETSAALSFIAGVSSGGSGEGWERLAFPSGGSN